MTKTELIVQLQKLINEEKEIQRTALYQHCSDSASGRAEAYEHVLELLEDLDD